MLEDTPQETSGADPAALSLSGSVKDLKTVAMYDLDDGVAPVVGWLVIYKGPEQGRSYELKSGKNTLGRTGNSVPDICLDEDKAISRGPQATVIYDPKHVKFLLQTTDGASLLYLNEALVMTFQELHAYDHITLGETEMIFVPFCTEEVQW